MASWEAVREDTTPPLPLEAVKYCIDSCFYGLIWYIVPFQTEKENRYKKKLVALAEMIACLLVVGFESGPQRVILNTLKLYLLLQRDTYIDSRENVLVPTL